MDRKTNLWCYIQIDNGITEVSLILPEMMMISTVISSSYHIFLAEVEVLNI